MRRFFLPALAATLLLSLALVPAAQAMRVDGSTLDPAPAQAAEATAVVELGNYVVAASAAYKELDACRCCCSAFVLPSHRCAACVTTSAAIRQVVARVRNVQARLARLDVPEQARTVHNELVAAAGLMHVSGDYMAAEVLADPRRLVVAAGARRRNEGLPQHVAPLAGHRARRATRGLPRRAPRADVPDAASPRSGDRDHARTRSLRRSGRAGPDVPHRLATGRPATRAPAGHRVPRRGVPLTPGAAAGG